MSSKLGRAHAGTLVATGGFGGALARYGVDVAIGATLQATLLVNVTGSFVLGLVLAGWIGSSGRQRVRRFAATGFLSSFTTYSTFVVGAIQQEPLNGLAYVLVTYVAGFGAAAVGIAIGERSGVSW